MIVVFSRDMRKVLRREFFERSTLVVAGELLGKFLVRKERGRERAYMIVEVEAYDGHEDKASHASRGKTGRTEVMFGEAGVWYVYFIYGMYHMLNIVTGEEGYPAAALIRGVEGINGPGRLTKALNITKERFNRKSAAPETGFWIEDRGVKVAKRRIQKTPRIGVAYAGDWAGKPYRFVLVEGGRGV